MKELLKKFSTEKEFISKHLFFVEVSVNQASKKKFKGINLHKHNALETKIIQPHKKY